MKNKINLVLVLLVFSLTFVSCGKKTEAADNGCFLTMDAAAENAKKNKQDILLIITTGDDDEPSRNFCANVLNAPEFKSEISSKYSIVNFDFSEASYQKTVVREDSTPAEQKAADAYADMMYQNAKVASLLNVQAAPSVFIFTKEKYYVDEIIFENDVSNVKEFAALISNYNGRMAEVNEMVKATEKGSVAERVLAIDALFESTDAVYKTFLSDLIAKVIELDKKNETGLLSKYIVADANAKASDSFTEGNVLDAVNAFTSAAKSPYLEPGHIQQLYYMAAYILAMSGSTDYPVMLDYLQKSLDADPESENAEGVAMFKSYIEATISE